MSEQKTKQGVPTMIARDGIDTVRAMQFENAFGPEAAHRYLRAGLTFEDARLENQLEGQLPELAKKARIDGMSATEALLRLRKERQKR